MNCMLSLLDRPDLRAHVEAWMSSISTDNLQWVAIAAVSLGAVYAGYLYIQCQREAAIAFTVPIPAEVRNGSTGKKWEEVQGQEKKVLEDQVKGVSGTTQGSSRPIGANYWGFARNGTIN